MRRADRAQSREFSLDLIDRCSHGVLALTTGEDTPYCLPLSFARVEDRLYFHCAKEGRKLDLLRKCPKVCVTFVGSDEPDFVAPSTFTTYFRSVIVTGTAAEVTDPEEQCLGLEAICQKLLPGHMAAFDDAVAEAIAVTAVWRIDMEDISGKAKLR